MPNPTPERKSVAELARAVLAAHPELSTPAELGAKLRELHAWVSKQSTNGTRVTCRRVLAERARHPALDEELEAGSPPWVVVNDRYEWSSSKGSFSRKVADVDEMFAAYSRHGLNKTGTQMINDYGLSLWEWATLKQRLMLQKESNVFSPHTVSITPPAELEAMMQAKISQRYEKQGPLIERAVRDAAVRELNRKLGGLDKRDASLDRITLALTDLLPTLKYRYVAKAAPAPGGPAWLVVTIADPHIGAEVKKLLNAPRYDQATLYRYADQLAERVNARGAAAVVLAGLGDYIESFAGANHANTFLSLNKDMAGAAGIFAALEFFSYLVSRVHNVREIWGVSGNHDRTSNRKDEDTRGEAAMLLFGLLKERFAPAGLTIIYRHDVLAREIDGICYLLTHGHLGLSKGDKNIQQTIARHRIPGRYCVVLEAHLHSRITKLDSEDYCVRHSPSFFTGNGYSSDGGWTTLAGFLTSENSAGSGYPRVVDEPLYNQHFSFASIATQSIV